MRASSMRPFVVEPVVRGRAVPRGASVQPAAVAGRASMATKGASGSRSPRRSQRLLAGVEGLDAAHDDALEGVAALRAEPGRARGLLRHGRRGGSKFRL